MTFILGWHRAAGFFLYGPLHLHAKICSSFLLLSSERRPWDKIGILKFVSPCHYMAAAHIWLQVRFRGLIEKKIADSRVQNENVLLIVLKKREGLSQLRDATTSFLATPLHSLKRRQYNAIYFELSKSFTLKGVMDESPVLSLFWVVWHGRSILSLWAHWAVVFHLLGSSWNIYIHSTRNW